MQRSSPAGWLYYYGVPPAGGYPGSAPHNTHPSLSVQGGHAGGTGTLRLSPSGQLMKCDTALAAERKK